MKVPLHSVNCSALTKVLFGCYGMGYYFCIAHGGRQEVVSVARLMLAHLDLNEAGQVAQPRRQGRSPFRVPPNPSLQGSPPLRGNVRTRSGRLVRLPIRFCASGSGRGSCGGRHVLWR